MRKMLVIASREYQAAVRSKTFIISLVILPIMMVGSIPLQLLLKGVVDTKDKHIVLVSAGAPRQILERIRDEIDEHNLKNIYDPDTKKQIKPKLDYTVEQAGRTPDDQARQRLSLSDRVREGDLVGFMEIKPAGNQATSAKKEAPPSPNKDGLAIHSAKHVQVFLRYQTNRPRYVDFSRLLEKAVQDQVRNDLSKKTGLSKAQTEALVNPVALESKGLARKDPQTGQIEEGSDQSRFTSLIVPAAMMMLMFMLILMTATPLMQGVVEEKMQRIAEVLLGSVRPFELMMGKLLGMVGVSLTIAAVYLGGAYWAADRFDLADNIGFDLLAWFVAFAALAVLMYGSLFIAVGAACTEIKETQNLMWPVMLLACLPMFLLGNILQEPNSAVARGLSFFPFATPTLMIARIASPPGIPWWEPALGVALVLATTVACVYAAGRIFRVGILVQGKGARLGQILRWVVRG